MIYDKTLIYGSGRYGVLAALECEQKGIKVAGFIDKNAKEIKARLGLPVHSPEYLKSLKTPCRIIIGIKDGKAIKEIQNYLKKLSFSFEVFYPNHISKTFKNYQSALQYCETQHGYENQELNKMRYLNTIATTIPYVFKWNAAVLFIIQRCFSERSLKKISVLDFGGEYGITYFQVRKFFPKFKFNWNVVEVPAVVSIAKKSNLESSELKFFNNIEDVPANIDFVNVSGSLQYVPDWKVYLNKLLLVKPKYIFFHRTSFCQGKSDIVTVQKSKLSDNCIFLKLSREQANKDIYYPTTFISFINFLNMFKEKYVLESKFELYEDLTMFGKNLFRKGLLFKRLSKFSILS